MSSVSRRLFKWFGLTLLLISVVGYGYFFTSNNLFTSAIDQIFNTIKRQTPSFAKEYTASSEQEYRPYYLLPNSDPLKQFDIAHSPYYDRRVVNGLSEAFKEYVRLFGLNSNISVNVAVSSRQIDINHFRLTYDVSLNDRNRTYEVDISTEAKHLLESIQSLRDILNRFSHDFSKFVVPVSAIKQVKSETITDILRMIHRFDYMDMFEALRQIEKQVSVDHQYAPEMLLSASEVFSWLAFLGRRYPRTDPAPANDQPPAPPARQR